MIDIEKLTALAIAYDAGDAKRIQHFIKVYAYSRLLGRREGLDEQKQNVLEAAAVLHDIGIHEAERKHGSSGGHWQEIEGPAVAAPMLQQCGADERESERVQWLIAHHRIDSVETSGPIYFRNQPLGCTRFRAAVRRSARWRPPVCRPDAGALKASCRSTKRPAESTWTLYRAKNAR